MYAAKDTSGKWFGFEGQGGENSTFPTFQDLDRAEGFCRLVRELPTVEDEYVELKVYPITADELREVLMDPGAEHVEG